MISSIVGCWESAPVASVAIAAAMLPAMLVIVTVFATWSFERCCLGVEASKRKAKKTEIMKILSETAYIELSKYKNRYQKDDSNKKSINKTSPTTLSSAPNYTYTFKIN